MLPVHEIFASICGEQPFTGTPTVFVRLYGCNLSCSWCDTPQEDVDVTHMTLDDIYSCIQDCTKEMCTQHTAVTITGGEPLLHREELEKLVYKLYKKNHPVIIETNGTLPMDKRLLSIPLVLISCSPKCNTKIEKSIFESAFSFRYSLDVDEGVSRLDGLPHNTPRPRASAHVCVGPRDTNNFEANVRLAYSVVLKHGYTFTCQEHKLLNFR